MNYLIYTSHHFTPYGKIQTQLIVLAPNLWLPSSVGTEHRTSIMEVTGSNLVEALIFSRLFFPIA